MIDYSKPKLSRNRGVTAANYVGEKYEFRDGTRRRTGTVQLNQKLK
jgi:hypothetical protein